MASIYYYCLEYGGAEMVLAVLVSVIEAVRDHGDACVRQEVKLQVFLSCLMQA
jgi:hypothetical protein